MLDAEMDPELSEGSGMSYRDGLEVMSVILAIWYGSVEPVRGEIPEALIRGLTAHALRKGWSYSVGSASKGRAEVLFLPPPPPSGLVAPLAGGTHLRPPPGGMLAVAAFEGGSLATLLSGAAEGPVDVRIMGSSAPYCKYVAHELGWKLDHEGPGGKFRFSRKGT